MRVRKKQEKERGRGRGKGKETRAEGEGKISQQAGCGGNCGQSMQKISAREIAL